MSRRDPNFDRGLAFGWLGGALSTIAFFWFFFLAGDLIGVRYGTDQSLMRTLVSARPLGSVIGFAVATIAGVIPGVLLGMAAALSFHPNRRLAVLIGCFIFANVFAIVACTVLVAGIKADPVLRDFVRAHELAGTGILGWLAHYQPLLHGTWMIAAGGALGLSWVLFEAMSKLDEAQQATRRHAGQRS